MPARIHIASASPEAYKAVTQLERYIRQSGLEESLLHLIRVRVSQINHCAFCIDMHWKDARAAGVTEERLYMLDAWREATVYSPRERAALAVAEAVTHISVEGLPDPIYEQARKHFEERDLENLVLAVSTINVWNRLGISFRIEPGHYTPGALEAHT
jgi:AhpD family alkylhydroperoxidase